MTQIQAEMATQLPQSLPSFAQTFGGPSLNRMSDVNNALPPIQHRPQPIDRSRSAHTSPQPSSMGDHKQNARKRLHSESTIADTSDTLGVEEHRSPRSVKVKEERDSDDLPPPKPTASSQKVGAPAQSSSSSSSPNPNPSKKRRMTITGINTDVRRPSVDSGISPVVMGLTIPPDDPNALEQVRSMVNLKHQQQALIESRRGSLASVVPPTAPPDVNIVNSLAASDDRNSSSKPSVRASRRSPNLPATSGLPSRGSIVAASATAPPPQQQQQQPPQGTMPVERRQSPPPTAVPISATRTHPRPATDSPPTQTHVHVAGPSNHVPTPQHSLPAPPISFARRRATRQIGGGLKGKPADIVISPRHPQEGILQPIIQSAPPIPRGGQTQSLPGRFPSMALPSVPPVMGTGQPPKRISTGPVPPTPTRLSTLRQPVAGPAATGRSPPAASVPIATSLVPPTPASLHHPGYTGEKSAFLAPFEAFYDALNDSKQLKGWLGEQLQKSNALISTLQRQQEQMEDAVRQLVDKKMASMRSEVYDLKMRVDDLESQLRYARAQGYSPNLNPSSVRDKGKANGYGVSSPVVGPIVPDTYHFPPIDPLQQQRRPEPIRRVSSPSSEHQPVSLTGSPVPFDIGKRLSVSAIRHEPPPVHASSSTRGPTRDRVERDLPHNLPPHPSVHRDRDHHGSGSGSMGGWSPRATKLSLPTSSTRHSLSQSTSGLGRRSSIDRGSGHGHGHARHDSASSIRSSHQHHAPPPEKRRASRTPEADEEGRVAAPLRHSLEQERSSIGGTAQQEKSRSDMDTS